MSSLNSMTTENSAQVDARQKMQQLIHSKSTAQLKDMSRMLWNQLWQDKTNRDLRIVAIAVDYELISRIGTRAFDRFADTR